ncbi:hypothetical protein [Chryseobacterium indoltheticum]|uniref:hypothetical protein n=1 Tax=Chryseobacterium indoltheticum TaxID=254 RepID=UPI003F491F53
MQDHLHQNGRPRGRSYVTTTWPELLVVQGSSKEDIIMLMMTFSSEDGYTTVGEKVFFKVGDIVTELWINKPVYTLGENITASWTDSRELLKTG